MSSLPPLKPSRKRRIVIGAGLIGVLLLSGYFLNRPPDWKKTEQGKAILQARSIGSARALRDVIAKFPNSPAAHAAFAELPAVLLRNASGTSSSATYRELLKEFPESKEADEARAALPDALLHEARQRKSLGPFRSLIQEFPDSSEAAQAQSEIHNLYAAPLDQFRARFAGVTPQTIFIERLASYLEHNGQAVEVRYLAHKGRKAEFTDYEPARWDAEVVLRGLRRLFADFQNGTLELEQGSELAEVGEVSRPTVAIEYVKRMNDSMYSSKGGGFAVGDDVTLKLSLRIPGEATKFDLSASGRTPAHFAAPKDNAFTKTSELAIEAALDKVCKQFAPSAPGKRRHHE